MGYTQNWNGEFIKNTSFLDRHSLTNVLEIGCYEALTSNYIVNNLLTHDGTLVCVDPLEDNYQLDSDPVVFKGQFDRFTENTAANKDRIWLIRKKSENVLSSLRDNSMEFIYVDGHHTFNAVYFDGCESFRICKVGGYILFDDYLWNLDVQKAIDNVLATNKNYKLLLKLNQVLIQKLPEGSETEDGQDEYQTKTTEILFGWDKIYARYCNLDIREDRELRMQNELTRIGLQQQILRTRSFPWEEIYNKFNEEEREKTQIMLLRTPGAIGCFYSQLEVMKEALRQGKHAMVFEDDLLVCDDLPSRLNIIYKFLNQHEWDVFWFGGTYHNEPHWHKSVEGKHTHPDLQMCDCTLNRDWEETLNPHIVKTFAAFSTHAYFVNKDRLEHIINFLERTMHLSMGIDFSFILEQPKLNCYAFNPGCIKQYDSMSNISNGYAVQSGFERLGKHFWAASMNEI